MALFWCSRAYFVRDAHHVGAFSARLICDEVVAIP